MTVITPKYLIGLVEATDSGQVEWGIHVPDKRSGIYIVTTADPVDGQHVVYIGLSKCLSRRLSQFYRHKYGAKSPHRGGQEILNLTSPMTVHWAAIDDYAAAEDTVLETFRMVVGQRPFGNRIKSARRTCYKH